MEFKEASRSDIRMKMALAGKSGSGKTLSSLLIASGLTAGEMNRVGVAQTEAGRAQCYINRFAKKFNVLEMKPPFAPESFVKVIELAESAGFKVLIIDSLSDEWAGIGGALDIHQEVSEVTKNTFTAWKKVTPKHDAVFNKILSSPIHIICTIRKKTDTIIENVNGKQVIKRVGLKDIAREDTEYKWILQFDLDQDGNLASVSKDNTGIFQGRPPFKITEKTGVEIRSWCLNNEEKENAGIKQSFVDGEAGARP